MSGVADSSNKRSRGSHADADGTTRKLRPEELEERLTQRLSLIKHRVVVMSGKGGVGKSTVAVNLASALSKSGKKVGVLDGDVHGPDVPKMFGLQGRSVEAGPGGLLPVTGPQDVEIMSMAFLIPGEDTPVAWRGPLKHSLFQQFLADVDWGELDYLIVDLPPGTGDETLSIAQLMGKPLWAVIVTTPQDVALLDSRKAVVFGKTLEANVLGIIENMSSLQCPYCGKQIDLFKVGGGEKAAHELCVPFLGRIPIDPDVVLGGDEGMPIVLQQPASRVAEAFEELAREVDEAVKGFS